MKYQYCVIEGKHEEDLVVWFDNLEDAIKYKSNWCGKSTRICKEVFT